MKKTTINKMLAIITASILCFTSILTVYADEPVQENESVIEASDMEHVETTTEDTESITEDAEVITSTETLTETVTNKEIEAIIEKNSATEEIIETTVNVSTSKPSTLTGLKATADGKRRVKLTWTQVSNVEGYLIYGMNGANNTYHYIGMTSNTSFTDTKASDTDYNFYWVFPYVKNSAGKMITGNCTKYVFAKGICSAVTNLKASSLKTGIKLTWSSVYSADGYLIYGMNGANNTYHYIGMTSNTSFTDTKASASNWNFYWVFPYHNDASGKMITGNVNNYIYGKSLVRVEAKYTQESKSPYREYLTIYGYNWDSSLIWSYTTDKYYSAQIRRVDSIGQWISLFYFNEDGTIKALDTSTGNIKWTNSDFNGAFFNTAGSPSKPIIDPRNGSIYLSGALGPCFCAISSSGQTLMRNSDFGGGAIMPYSTMVLNGNTLTLMAVDSTASPAAHYKIIINLTNFTYTKNYLGTY